MQIKVRLLQAELVGTVRCAEAQATCHCLQDKANMVIPTYQKSPAVMSYLQKAGLQDQAMEFHRYPPSKFKHKPEVPPRKNR